MDKTNPKPRKVYTIDQVCEIAQIGRTRLYQEIRDRRLKTKKLGARTLILESELDRWLESLPEA